MAVAVAIAISPFWISRRGSGEPNPAFFGFVPLVDRPALKEQHLEVEGCVRTVLPGAMFRVEPGDWHLTPRRDL
jgi:hypothetical protein